ncbi:MAG TPA: beta-galactosidase [Capsulimonadaceae bacterium]
MSRPRICRALVLRVAALLACVAACASLPAANAANIAPSAYLVHDYVAVNEGRACDQYLPIASRPWEDNKPFVEPVAAEIWFPYAHPPTVKGISFWAQFDTPQTGEIQAWNGVSWATVGKLPVVTGRVSGVRRVVFDTPVTTSGVRVLITKVGNTDHDVLHLTGFDIQGDLTATTKLYDPNDLAITCAAKWNVFDLPTAPRVDVAIGNSVGGTTRLRVVSSWANTYGDPVGTSDTTERMDLAKGASKSFAMTLPAKEQGLYCATVSVYDDSRGILLARKRILVGSRDPKIFDAGIVPSFEPAGKTIVPYAQHLKELGCLWTAELAQCPSSLVRRPGEPAFQVLKKAGTDVVGAFFCYNDFEPLPGVYNFAYFDWMVTQANRNKLGLDVGLWRWEFGPSDQYWLKDETIKLRDGSPGTGWKNLYSFWGPQYTEHAFRAVEVLVKRYRNSPAVWMWYPHPFGKVDHDNAGIEDYSTYAYAAYHRFLMLKYGEIDKLNAAYGTSYSTWNDIAMPDPLWRDLYAKKNFVEGTRVLDTRTQWDDYLTFFHEDGILRWREGLLKLVRGLDPVRGFDGTDATHGVAAADKTLAAVVKYGGSEGDENIEGLHYTRRFIGKLQYDLPSRYEDSSPVIYGRIKADLAERSSWDVYQACFLGANQFNYAFPVWDTSPFFDMVYSNPRAQKMVKLAAASTLVAQPIAHLHSFDTDTHEGEYVLNGISVYRWWLMNGFSRAMLEPGRFFTPFSEGGPLARLDNMQVIIDDGSRIMSLTTIDRLVHFVRGGGKLVLRAGSGERLPGDTSSTYPLLRALGYGDVEPLSTINPGVAQLIFHQHNGVFNELGSLPVHDYRVLTAPAGGSVIGTVNGLPGAVTWPVGNGDVVLIGATVGSISAATLQENAASSDAAVRKANDTIFGDAENEQAQAAMLMIRDMMRWAGLKRSFTVDDGFYGCLRQSGATQLVYLYNPGAAAGTGLRITLPAVKKYAVTLDSLTETRALGQFTGATLAAGIVLPTIKHAQTVLVRITPAGPHK